MPYKFQPGKMYRMPTHFGPSLGPRQGVGGRKYTNLNSPKTTTREVSFLSNKQQLEALLPENFEVGTEPIVTVRAKYITEIEWLAGRGYNTLGVSFPAVFHGKDDHIEGDFLMVLWENLPDPILTGRDELGFSKIYCELPEPRINQDHTHCIASWLGFKFMDLKFCNMTRLTQKEIDEYLSNLRSSGMLHFKYIPKTGEWGKADIMYATFTPQSNPNRVITEMWRGEGIAQFYEATWEDLPTMYHIVNAFYSLEIIEYRGSKIIKSIGGKDIGDQRILR
ncbi:MAG: acetoacetate decarboxylase family protein [Candidatus Bathyarchaeota archaeon]|nr:MAG: acetoacetate decarboxylase family protein [Candidatus Bathyarchaeota archaeon]